MSTRILYVEDEVFLAKIVTESLASRGFDVVLEGDGDKAVVLFQQMLPDICVLDIMLKGSDGFAIAEAIRKINATVPIIFLTAKTQIEDLVKGFTLGGNDYIRKPFSMEELIIRIQYHLQRKPQPVSAEKPDVITIGSYRFELSRQLLSQHGMARKLSFRESELLRLLYENRHRIIDRREVMNLMWGNDSFFNSRNLDVYITKLRRYLKEDPSLEIITIKGIGYRFVL